MEREHAQYEYELNTILLRPRNHLKTVFHEFYHHLDNMTDGLYDSDDHQGGTSSLAWMFAELLWKEFSVRIRRRIEKRCNMKKQKKHDPIEEEIDADEIKEQVPDTPIVKGKKWLHKRDGCSGGSDAIAEVPTIGDFGIGSAFCLGLAFMAGTSPRRKTSGGTKLILRLSKPRVIMPPGTKIKDTGSAGCKC